MSAYVCIYVHVECTLLPKDEESMVRINDAKQELATLVGQF